MPELMKEPFIDFIHQLQNDICSELEQVDGKARFREDVWKRDGGGGGITRVIADGNVFEKGGVNTSVVHGELPEYIRERFGVSQAWFMAAGISLVIHPNSPLVPTVHANYRYFELYDSSEASTLADCWFGGGADLTPYYYLPEDARFFHQTHKDACDRVDSGLYPVFKHQCDRYFFNAHRGEARGIGGIFYDYLRPADSISHGSGQSQGSETSGSDVLSTLTSTQLFDLATSNGRAFIEAYIPIVHRNKDRKWTDEQRYWQEIRRGRYVEFNLIHDRGTLFGLKTNGRVESILMSLPPRVRWDYDFRPAEGSPEADLLHVLKHGVDF
jgi:coproporphyrinogen III oxidase